MPPILYLTDRCYLGTQSTPTGRNARAGITYDTDTTVRCLVMNPTPGETSQGSQVPTDGVRIAFREDSGITGRTRVQVIRRLHKTLATPERYEVMGDPRMVRNRLIAVCKRTTAGSAK